MNYCTFHLGRNRFKSWGHDKMSMGISLNYMEMQHGLSYQKGEKMFLKKLGACDTHPNNFLSLRY